MRVWSLLLGRGATQHKPEKPIPSPVPFRWHFFCETWSLGNDLLQSQHVVIMENSHDLLEDNLNRYLFLPETNTAPEKWWLGDDPFLLGLCQFSGAIRNFGEGTVIHNLFIEGNVQHPLGTLKTLRSGTHRHVPRRHNYISWDATTRFGVGQIGCFIHIWSYTYLSFGLKCKLRTTDYFKKIEPSFIPPKRTSA